MKLPTRTFIATAAAAALLVTAPAFAHKAWLLPSDTVLSQQGWITVDAAVSNDLFYFNHNPLRIDSLVVTAPDGSSVAPQNPATGKYRNTFDLQLTKDGTYRVALVNHSLNASYEADGKMKRWRGTPETFAKEVPANAPKLQVTQQSSRVETFVTVKAPTTDTLKISGSGLELQPLTHPNDLFAGEAAKFRFVLDGKPAPDVKIEIVPGGSRYRNAQKEILVTTDAKGEFSVTWPTPGMYWLEASAQGAKPSIPQAKERRASYIATLEVLQQ